MQEMRGNIDYTLSRVPDLASSTEDSSTAMTAFSTPHNPFNITPELTQAKTPKKKASPHHHPQILLS